MQAKTLEILIDLKEKLKKQSETGEKSYDIDQKLVHLYNELMEFEDIYIQNFEKATTIEEYGRLYCGYEALKAEIVSDMENHIEKEEAFKQLCETFESQTDSKKLKHRIVRFINKPFSNFVINADINNFTSDAGLKIRRKISGPIRPGVKLMVNGPINIEEYTGDIEKNYEGELSERYSGNFDNDKIGKLIDKFPKLPKDEPIILLSTHNFPEEANATIASLSRNAYFLMGTTDQIKHNLKILAAFLNGFLYVNRFNRASRNSAVDKEAIILNGGTDFLKYPEGGLNNSENMLVGNLFPATAKLIKKTGYKVLIVSTFRDHGSKVNNIAYSKLIDFSKYDNTDEITRNIRNIMASMTLKQIEKHSAPVKREELGLCPRHNFMRLVLEKYQQTPWTSPVFAEENSPYKPKGIVEERDVYKRLENLESVNKFIEEHVNHISYQKYLEDIYQSYSHRMKELIDIFKMEISDKEMERICKLCTFEDGLFKVQSQIDIENRIFKIFNSHLSKEEKEREVFKLLKEEKEKAINMLFARLTEVSSSQAAKAQRKANELKRDSEEFDIVAYLNENFDNKNLPKPNYLNGISKVMKR